VVDRWTKVPEPLEDRMATLREAAQAMGPVGALRVLAMTELMSRRQIAATAGLTFGGDRDLFSALGYKRDLLPQDYRDRFCRNGIAARVVRAFPRATWRGGAELIEDEDPEVSTDFEETWKEMDHRLHFWPILQRSDVLAGLGRYSVLLIGAPGELETELPPRLRPEDIAYMTPFGEDDAVIQKFDEDPASMRFGKPILYTIKRIGATTNSSNALRSFTRPVHWSRVIHIADGTLDDTVYGTPRLQDVWNWFDDLEKITGAGSEAFWIRAHQGYHFNLDKDVKITDDTKLQKMKDEAEDFANGLRRSIATRGMDVEVFGSDVANFANQVDALITLIAGAKEIPKRILVGSERGELSSSQDKGNWDERIQDRRQEYAEPLVQELVELFISHGVLPEPSEWKVRWPEIDELTDVQKADVADKWAGLNKKAGGPVVRSSEIRDRVLGLEPLTEEELAEMEELKPEPPVVEPVPPNSAPAGVPPQGEVPPSPPAGNPPPPPPKEASSPKAQPRGDLGGAGSLMSQSAGSGGS
jgi:hypothetical protein